MYVAIPALVSCVVASRAESSQYFAVASQNLTWPGFTGVDPETTVAVSVTTVPAVTDDMSEPPLVIANDVVVGAAEAHACGRMKPPQAASKHVRERRRKTKRARRDEPCICEFILDSRVSRTALTASADRRADSKNCRSLKATPDVL